MPVPSISVKAGSLRHLVTVQTKTIGSTGDRGQPVYTWPTLASVYAAVESIPPFGKKAEVARQLVASATHSITMRYLAGLTETSRIQWQGRTFTIGYIWDHEERNIWVTLLVTEQKTGLV